MLNLLVTAIVVPGIFATLAIPAYAYSPMTKDQLASQAAEQASKDVLELTKDGSQKVSVSESVAAAATARDGYTAVSAVEMNRVATAAALAAQRKSYSGPSAAQFLANPPYPSFALDSVVGVAMQYQGVPYVFGGDTPAGFDCSGFTMFVYAQFGIGLPHSSSRQGQLGTKIAKEAALPGDLVILDGGGHVGIYVGGGQMIDAPKPGGHVSVRAIYSSNYYIVRYGI